MLNGLVHRIQLIINSLRAIYHIHRTQTLRLSPSKEARKLPSLCPSSLSHCPIILVVPRMDLSQVCLELQRHLTDLVKVPLVQDDLVALLLSSFKVESILGQRDGGLESWVAQRQHSFNVKQSELIEAWENSKNPRVKWDRGRQSTINTSIICTVANFPPVPWQFPHFRVVEHEVLCTGLNDDAVLPFPLELVKELLPDLLPLWFFEVFIVDDDVDPGDKGVVECSHVVDGQEQDASIVL